MKIATNKYIQSFIKKTESKAFYDGLNRNLPIIETGFSGICYVAAIYLNKQLEEKRKPALCWQAILGCVSGMTISKYIDNSINNFKNNVCVELKNRNNIKNIEKITNGLKIAIPLITVATITRFLIPTILIPISTKIVEYKNKHKTKY